MTSALLVLALAASAQDFQVFTLKNKAGLEAKITNYGGILMSLKAPDRQGKFADIVLGFDTPQEYRDKNAGPYFGALIGRYANRIAKAQFNLDGKTYPLAANNGPNALHGGRIGFDKKFWTATQQGNRLTLTLISPDGEEGYPGELKASVVYTLTDSNELQIDYSASTTKPTVVNLTNHSYFNLSGGRDILSHELQLNASRFTPVDSGLIPTGELRPVSGTPFDFQKPTAIGARIDANDEQIRLGGGYDHNFILDGKTAATVYDPLSGRTLTVTTTEPAVQFYTGNFLDGTLTAKGGAKYTKRQAFCLETQHYPDSPNQPKFPTTILRPGQTYRSQTIFRFGVR